jgi:hypothetical protein
MRKLVQTGFKGYHAIRDNDATNLNERFDPHRACDRVIFRHGIQALSRARTTLEQAMLADMPVRITCESCGHFRQAHAFKVIRWIANRMRDRTLPLFQPVSGVFYCGDCQKTVKVTTNVPVASKACAIYTL